MDIKVKSMRFERAAMVVRGVEALEKPHRPADTTVAYRGITFIAMDPEYYLGAAVAVSLRDGFQLFLIPENATQVSDWYAELSRRMCEAV